MRIYQYMYGYQLLSTHGVGDSEVKWRRYLLVELRTCGIYECYQFYDHVKSLLSINLVEMSVLVWLFMIAVVDFMLLWMMSFFLYIPISIHNSLRCCQLSSLISLNRCLNLLVLTENYSSGCKLLMIRLPYFTRML